MRRTEARSKFAPLALEPLPLGSIRPGGWLLNQLRIQANGLSGHLDEFWPDVAQSGWIGGSEEGWERGPYWLDGVVPLAFLLDEKKLKIKVQHWMDYILAHQQEDGWLGPVQDVQHEYPAYDPWPVSIALKAMAQYQEATGDQRVIPAMTKFFCKLDNLLDHWPPAKTEKNPWAREVDLHRRADLALSIYWHCDRTGEDRFLSVADKAMEQGFDWCAHFADFRYKEKIDRDRASSPVHVVNNAMAIKHPAVLFRRSHDRRHRDAVFQFIEMLDRYHGQASGVFSGDEHYAGKNPSQGTELCAVVEYMFSLETLLSILGDLRFADRIERIAFNALPATFKPDMWAHQYVQQANQAVCKISEDRIYTTNGPEANVFGLEPHYGCCTANMHQGWPKFASHLWMRTPDGGIAAVAYAPSTVVAEIEGTSARIELETDYPFDDTLRLTVNVRDRVRFPLLLRIPSWTEKADIEIGNENPIQPKEGTFHRIEREWSGSTNIRLRLPMKAKLQRRYHNSVSIERGPLVYSLKIGEEWKMIKSELPHADWEVHPTTPWNYAVWIDKNNPEESIRFEKRRIGDCPFSPEGAPVVAKVKGRRIPSWGLEHNAAGPLPESPLDSREPLEDLTLIPYGCTNLRITEFPTLRTCRQLGRQ